MSIHIDPIPSPPHRGRRHTGRSRALLASAMLLVAAASTAAETLEGGYEIHREGETPHTRQFWQQFARATESACAEKGIPFRLSGDIATAGDIQIVEHHHPGLRKSSRVKRYSEPVTLSPCHIEMRHRQITTISHYDEETRTVFTHEIDPRVGARPWYRRTDPHLERETIDLLREALALDARIPQELRAGDVPVATAPGLKVDRIAGRECRWVHTPPPVESRSCMLSEGIGMPIDESLSAESGGVVDGRPIVLIRLKVVRFDGPIEIPASVFEPGERISVDHAPPNATVKWCEKEAARTGTNPCAGADDDLDDFDDEALEGDGDALVTHFNALIQEWCAVEDGRPGGTPCSADGPGLSDPRVRQSMASWCAEEAARTGVNRCEKRSHARARN